jgi:hypothetical protein
LETIYTLKKSNNNMGKYLHHYTSLDEFQANYNDNGGPASFVCSAGTFVYDRYEEINNHIVYVWVNGDKELWTLQRKAAVGDGCGELSGAYDPEAQEGDGCIEITAVGEAIPGTYIEPWVSYTDDKVARVRKFKATVGGLINGVRYDDEEHTFTIIGEAGFTI